LVYQKNISQAYQKILVGAIKLFYNELLRKNYKLNYLYSDRPERKLPVILDKTEVQLLLNSVDNLKHKAILSMIYSAGLRLNEAIEMKLSDFLVLQGFCMTHNGFAICVRAGFGAQNCQPALHLNRSTKLQVCTSPRLTQNPC
jgi:site-specific recombinase XerD